MLEKYKDEIKGAMISIGIWIIILNRFPAIHAWYSTVQGSLLIGIILIFIGVTIK